MPPATRAPGRALATFTIGFLLLDALLFGYSGVALHRIRNIVGAGACLLGALFVLVLWRRYRRAMLDVDRDRRELRAEVESIRDLLHSKHLHN